MLRAAVLLADENGLESLTMRELGLRLGVEAMSLYNHVANKDDLLDSYVYGFGRQQLNMSAGGGIEPEEMGAGFLRALPADEYPYLRELVVEYAMKAKYDENADFDFGLDLILDGLQRLLDRGES